MVFVTGGTGLLGSHLLLQLIKEGVSVKALIREKSNINNVLSTFSYYITNPDEAFSKIEWVNGDLMDYDSILNILNEVKEVYHVAALVSFNLKEKQEILNINVNGTANIVNAALETGVKKLCFVSSSSAIGKPAEGVLADENTIWKSRKGNSVYGISKFQSELEVWRSIEEGLNAVIVNPTIIIGPGNWNRGSSSIFSSVQKGMKYYTNGTTGFVDVRDVVQCMITLMKSEFSGERFILSEDNYSYKDIITMIANALNVKAPYKYANGLKTSLAWRLEAVKSKILGIYPKITKETALASHSQTEFSNEKVKETLNFEFIPIEESIRWSGECFLGEVHKLH